MCGATCLSILFQRRWRQDATGILTTRFVACVLIGLISACCLGCGKGQKRPLTIPVQGTVKFKNRPLTNGYVHFTPVTAGTTHPARGLIRPGGKFVMSTWSPGDGVQPGDYLISVVSFKARTAGSSATTQSASKPPRARTPAIPKKFFEPKRSGLRETITEDRGNRPLELNLTGKEPEPAPAPDPLPATDPLPVTGPQEVASREGTAPPSEGESDFIDSGMTGDSIWDQHFVLISSTAALSMAALIAGTIYIYRRKLRADAVSGPAFRAAAGGAILGYSRNSGQAAGPMDPQKTAAVLYERLSRTGGAGKIATRKSSGPPPLMGTDGSASPLQATYAADTGAADVGAADAAEVAADVEQAAERVAPPAEPADEDSRTVSPPEVDDFFTEYVMAESVTNLPEIGKTSRLLRKKSRNRSRKPKMLGGPPAEPAVAQERGDAEERQTLVFGSGVADEVENGVQESFASPEAPALPDQAFVHPAAECGSGVLVPQTQGQPIVLDKLTTVIGRSRSCDAVVRSSRGVSRRHCCITRVGEHYVIRDLDSANGLRVNGMRVVDSVLKHGDEIGIGNLAFVLSFPAATPGSGEIAAARQADVDHLGGAGSDDEAVDNAVEHEADAASGDPSHEPDDEPDDEFVRQREAAMRILQTNGNVYLQLSRSETARIDRVGDLPARPFHLLAAAFGNLSHDIDGDFLKMLVDFKYLQTIDLSSTPITDDSVAPLKEMTQLKGIALCATAVTDRSLEYLSGHQEMRVVRLRRTQISNYGLAILGGMRHLKTLDLRGTRITDGGLAHLSGLEDLEYLDVSHTAVGNAGLAHLRRMSRLTRLVLSVTAVRDAGLEDLSELRALKTLLLFQVDISDVGIRHLEGLTNLETLDLESTRITDAGLESLARLPALRHLYLSHTAVTQAGLQKLHETLPQCEIYA